MNLEDLLKRATASEHVLITTVLKLSDEEAAKAVRKRVSDFITRNFPPHPHNPGFREAQEQWVKRFNEAITEEGK
jgi:hypothetical protein